MKIDSREECRKQIMMYRFVEQTLNEMKSDDPAKLKEWLEETKRDVRAFLHRETDSYRRLVKSYGIDGYVERIECPSWIASMREAEEWFDESERIEMRHSQYDCTGQAFTGWHRIFDLGDKFVCYHYIAFDV